MSKATNSFSTQKQPKDIKLDKLSPRSKTESAQPKEKVVGEGPHTLLRSMDETKESKNMKKNSSRQTKTKPMTPAMLTVSALVIVLAGTVTGFGLSKVTAGSSGSNKKTEVTGIEEGTGKIKGGEVTVGEVLGNPAKEGDEAEGVLERGGINGEGSHKLLRPGGPSQTVYLTSSVVNLDQLEGHKVKVWGDTFAAQSAGWLMDVVTLEVVELDAEPPFAED